MKKFWSMLLVTLMLPVLSPKAHADTIESFNFQGTAGTFGGGFAPTGDIVYLYGYVTMDIDTFAVEYVYLGISGANPNVLYDDPNPSYDPPNNYAHSGLYSADAYSADYALAFPVVPGTPYAGGVLCGPNNPDCGIHDYSYVDGTGQTSYYFISANLVPATPEPSSIILFGTGAIAMFRGVRRRL